MNADFFGLHGLDWLDLLQLAGHFAVLSLLAVGGAITSASDMQRYLVVERGWIDPLQFNASVAIAQAAPGPNILFVALLGWSVAGPLGMLATMIGIMGPSSALTLFVGRFPHTRQDARPVRAFSIGLAAVLDEARRAPMAHHRGALGVAAAGQRQLHAPGVPQAVQVVTVAVQLAGLVQLADQLPEFEREPVFRVGTP